MSTDVRDRSLPEEGFHEIQLSGKQLVFLFMATTVVSVVIFLCGVLVGRGVRPSIADGAVIAAPASEAPDVAGADATPTEAPPAAEAPPPNYDPVLRAAKPPEETIAAPAETAAPAEARAEPPAAEPTPAATNPAPVGAGQPWVVQVTALKNKGEADAIAKRLGGRGYKAFVLDPQPGVNAFYRVRVGPFDDRGDAEQVMKRLATEEQFKPWISR